MTKRESEKQCGQVKGGSWYRYFSAGSNMVFDDKIMSKNDKFVLNTWGDFFEKHLSIEKGPIISLGAGFGRIEIPLARKGYQVIGLDNDRDVLRVLAENAEKYAKGKLIAVYGDLYKDFYKQFLGKGVQACVSFGLLEHFTLSDLQEVIKKQFLIVPLLICLMPVRTEATLKTFGAQEKPEGNVDRYGIYRNFWTSDFWEKEVFSKYRVVDKKIYAVQERRGFIDGLTLVVRERRDNEHEE